MGCRTLFSTHYHSLVDDFTSNEMVSLGHMVSTVALYFFASESSNPVCLFEGKRMMEERVEGCKDSWIEERIHG